MNNTLEWMGNLFVCVLILSLALTSCSRNAATAGDDFDNGPIPVVHSPDTTVFGTWYWIRTQGGFSGQSITPSSAGYVQKYVFTRDSVCKLYRNTVLDRSTRFSIRRQVSPGIPDSVDLIYFADQPDEIIQTRIWLQGSDTLHLDDFNIMDGFDDTYVRIGLGEESGN